MLKQIPILSIYFHIVTPQNVDNVHRDENFSKVYLVIVINL